MKFNYHKKLMKSIAFYCISSIALIILLWGCSSDDNNPSETLTAQEVVEIGWTKFENHNYIEAKTEFETAIEMDGNLADAQNGAGWATGRIPGGLQDAKSFFERAITLDSTEFDAKGGLIFIDFQLGEWRQVLKQVDSLLTRLPGWRFLHEPTIDFRDLILTTALCHYNLGEYAKAMEIILNNSYLNPQFDADISTDSGRRELLEELERLGVIHG